MSASTGNEKVELTFLGQAGFIIKYGKIQLIIDPYLSNYVIDGGIGSATLFSREFPPPVLPEKLPRVKFVFLTHDHADHCDPETLLPVYSANPSVKFVCPRPVAHHLEKLGVKKKNIVVPETLALNHEEGLDFYAVPAAHYALDRDEKTGEYSYFSFVIKIGDKWIFHAGDTIQYGGFAGNILKHTKKIDVALLPVNGRDAVRESQGIIGNLDGEEALYLARDTQSDIFIPIHNDLFSSNHVSIAVLADLIERRKPKLKIHWLKPGETFIVP
jgi:L-ascorbate metabolism protein UlaG (beta-lactamase superfamily)